MTALLPLYANTIAKGEFPPQWRSQPMPQVDLAQQQYVRYPFDGESSVSMHGWSRQRDSVASASTSQV
jgi:hypothetical protein